MAPPPTDGPRFDLQVDRRGGALRLRAGVRAGIAEVQRLELGVAIEGPLDLRLGPQKLRRRRTETRLAEVRVQLPARPNATLQGAGLVGLHVLDEKTARLLVELEDEVGVLALELSLYAEGNDLVLVPEDLRWLCEGPFSPWDRVIRIVRAVGRAAGEGRGHLDGDPLRFDPRVGAFRIVAPVRQTLRGALVVHGWRVPNSPPDALALRVRGGELILRIETRPMADDARRRPSSSEDITRALVAESPAASAPEWIRAVHVGATRGPLARLTEHLAEREFAAAREQLEWLRRSEPARQLVAESLDRLARALLDHADALLFEDEEESLDTQSNLRDLEEDLGEIVDEAADLMLESLAMRPARESRWRRALDLFASHGAPATVRIAHAAMASPLPRGVRALLASRALEAVARDEYEVGQTAFDGMVDALIRAVREHGSPARAAAARAIHAARGGDLAAAASAWQLAADEAQREQLSAELAARFRRRAATYVARSAGPEAARPIFEQALAQSGDGPQCIIELADVALDAGDDLRAEELYARLLTLEAPLDDEFVDALLTAARFHLERGASDRARPFLSAMGPALSPTAPVLAMSPRTPEPIEDDPPAAPREVPPAGGEQRNELSDRLVGERDADGMTGMRRRPQLEELLAARRAELAEREAGENAPDHEGDGPQPDRDEPNPHERSLSSIPASGAASGAFVAARGDAAEPDELPEETPEETPEEMPEAEDEPGEGAARAGADIDPNPEEVDLRFPEKEGPSSDISSLIGLPRGEARSDLPDVTLVSVADEEVRALLEACDDHSDAGAVLEAALEGAISERDGEGIRRVLRVLERLGDVRGRRGIRERAEATLKSIGEDDE